MPTSQLPSAPETMPGEAVDPTNVAVAQLRLSTPATTHSRGRRLSRRQHRDLHSAGGGRRDELADRDRHHRGARRHRCAHRMSGASRLSAVVEGDRREAARP